MNGIQQIYCTHCTYGSSALEHREGEFADRTLGYSARASSLEHADLRKYYRAVERFLSYYLPTDTPTEEKLRLTASQAPKRLVYHPDFNGLQFLAQVCYRQQDTAGRPGSYFGHVLLGDRTKAPWDVGNCLRLWGADWVAQDSPDLPLEIPPLNDLKDLRRGAKPALSDGLLLSFLTAEADADFDDPLGVLPARWKQKAPAERADLLADILQNYLESGCARKESVVLVVEPEVAALLFYGVARLLPAGPLRQRISFSTFEPSVDRLSVLLAATTFHAPDATDLRPDAYRGRGWVHNTFLDRSSDRPSATGIYGRMIVERLCEDGWASVDHLLGDFPSVATPAELDGLARVRQLAPALLNLDAEPPSLDRSPPAALAYLGRTLRERLHLLRPGSEQLVQLGASPRLLTLLDLTARDAADPLGKAALGFLIGRLPEERFPEFLGSDKIDLHFKVAALLSFFNRAQRFPAGCDALWDATPSGLAPEPTSPRMMLAETLARAPGTMLKAVVRDERGEHLEALWLALARASSRHSGNGYLLEALGDVVAKTPDGLLCEFLRRHVRELATGNDRGYPRDEQVLCEKLDEWYEGLPQSADRFSERLEALQKWKEYCTNVPEMEKRLPRWAELRGMLLSFAADGAAKSAPSRAGLFNKTPKFDADATALRMAVLINSWLMPHPKYSLEDAGPKWNCLRDIGAGLLNDRDFLPETTWQNLQMYFQGYGWSDSRWKKSRDRGQRRQKILQWLLIVIPGVAAVGLIGVFYYYFNTHAQGSGVKPPAAHASSKAPPKPGDHGPSNAKPTPPQPSDPHVPVTAPAEPSSGSSLPKSSPPPAQNDGTPTQYGR